MSVVTVEALSIGSDSGDFVQTAVATLVHSTSMPVAGAIKDAVPADPSSTTSQIFTAIWSVIMWLIRYPGLLILGLAVIGFVVALTAFSICFIMSMETKNNDFVTSWIMGAWAGYVVLLVIFGIYNDNLPPGQGSWTMTVVEAGVVIMLLCVASLVVAAIVWLVRWFGYRGDGDGMRKAEGV